MPEKQNDYRVAVFGAGGVGKSSLVQRFVKGTFRESYIPTIEDTYRQVITCNKQVCTLEITDTTGSHQFPAMQRLSISRAHAFLLVYSTTSRGSLDEMVKIHNELFRVKAEELTQTPLMLVGNKSDEADAREVSTAQGQTLSKRLNCGFIETSAKENRNVSEMFQNLLEMETRRNIALMQENSKRGIGDRLFGWCRSAGKQAKKDGPKTFNLQADENGIVTRLPEDKKAAKAKQEELKKQKKEEQKKQKEEAKKKKEEAKADAKEPPKEGEQPPAEGKKCIVM